MTRLLLLTLALAACQPWYRDPELAGQRATDFKRVAALVNEANTASSKGNHARAEALLREAIDEVPDEGADNYLLLARESLAAHDLAGARAVSRRGIQMFPSSAAQFRAILVEDKLGADMTAAAIDVAGATTLEEATSAVGPLLQPLQRAVAAEHDDTAAGELALFLAHYGIADHPLLHKARAEVAMRLSHAVGFAELADQADAELAAGHLERALALYGDVYRLLPESILEAHMTSFAKAAHQATDPEAIDEGAYALALTGNKDADAGLIGLAIHDYRKVVARAPWWIEAHENLAALFDAAGRSEEAAAERAFVKRIGDGVKLP